MSAETPPGPERPVCQQCKQALPTAQMRFLQNEGRLLLHNVTRIRGRFCGRCGMAWCGRFTRVTLVKGWWSPTSLLVVPVFLLVNLWGFAKCAVLRLRG